MRLTTHLLTRILISGTAVLVVVVLWLIVSGHRATLGNLERTVSAMERILELQFVGLTQSAGMEPKFPDWYPVTQVARPDGACVRLFDAEGSLLRSACRGRAEHRLSTPAWFARFYAATFDPGAKIQREIDGGSRPALLELVPDAEAEIVTAWNEAKTLAFPAALLIGALCLTVWWSVRRAFEPAHAIMIGLAAIERGVLDSRLGPYPWVEFDRIASACNTLAESLASSQAARTALSRRLLKVQEEERHTLARELHDEFGQHLSAVSANAAALRVALDVPMYIEDAHRIEDSAGHLMQLVRDLLQRLRPWSAGGTDLAESLRGLAGELGFGHRGRPRIEFDLVGPFDDLPVILSGAIYRIVQEALTNSLRHADAANVTISVTRAQNTLNIAIVDDGRGCEDDDLDCGFGIVGIRERAAAFDGKVEFERNDEGGLTVLVHFADPFASSVAV